MRMREVAKATVIAAALSAVLLSGCTGGQESSAAEEQQPKKNPIATTDSVAAPNQPQADPSKELKSISPAIPVYAGARYRDDLTRRDSVMVKNQYGPNAEVITLATDDSFPQVYHYYTTYLAQFRAYPPQPPFPPQQNWRTLEVQLNQAMQDPFIPGDTLKAQDKQVVLQVAETEAEPKTVIRYIITPAGSNAGQVAAK
jgi:outer membrane murein-binding lipoprotein Lpp